MDAPTERETDPIFVSSPSVREVFNEPETVVRLRYGLMKPDSFADVVEHLKAVNMLGDTNPYNMKVKPLVQRIKDFYPGLTVDELEALCATTLAMPRYYEHKNNLHYNYQPGSRIDHERPWSCFIHHVDQGMVKLAALHRRVADGFDSAEGFLPSPKTLSRVAFIPKQVFHEHVKVGNRVIFRAPMSAAEEPQWVFLKHGDAETCIPVLLRFDEVACRRAVHLGAKDNAISVFGEKEGEWLLPRYMRFTVEDLVPDDSGHTVSGEIIQVVHLKGHHWTVPSTNLACSVQDALCSAVMLGVVFDQSGPVLDALVRVLDGVGGVLGVPSRTDSAIFSHFAPLVSSPLGSTYLGLVNSRHDEVQDAFKKGISRCASLDGDLESVDIGKIADLVANAYRSQEDLATAVPQLANEYWQEPNLIRWAALLSIIRLAAQVRLADPKGDALFAASGWSYFARGNNPFNAVRSLHALDALLAQGNTFWTESDLAPSRAMRSAQDIVQRTLAWEAVLRIRMSSMKAVALLGEMDAGKSTFLKHVYDIAVATGLDEEGRTDTVNAYKHPLFDEEFCPAYVLDTPGLGDVVSHRNDHVRLTVTCVRGLPGQCCVVWTLTAQRGRKDETAERVFKAVLPLVGCIVVTQIDKLIDERWKDRCRQWIEDEVEDEAVFEEGKQQVMTSAKEDVETFLKELCGDEPCPPVVYTVLLPSSWACRPEQGTRRTKGKSKGKSMSADPPKWWDTAPADVKEAFGLKSASELRCLLDTMAGII